ncbi:MAG TPA: hypothetical protein VGJ84_21495, partial [Polyangiaceae bacterium]
IYPHTGRAVLLRDGYLYTDNPDFAYVLVSFVGVEHLFDEPQIWIQRGERLYTATRIPTGSYVYDDGLEAGKPVKLILFDRLGTGAPPPALHRDLRSLRYRLHFDRMEIRHATHDFLLADLSYGAITVPTVLSAQGPRLELKCEAVPPDRAVDLSLFRDIAARRQRAVQALRQVMLSEIDEKLPFDEPYKEWGQQDGILRQAWMSHYQLGEQRFEFNGDDYYVFDLKGRPRVPQVCVDFLTDTFERASGTWWRGRGGPLQRHVGRLDFGTLQDPLLRRVPGFIELARSKPDWFDVYDTDPREQIPLRRKNELSSYLQRNSHRYAPGDIVVIRGFTNFEKRGQERLMHYHSFFIYESDPLSGFPIALAGNAGQPSLRVWDTEARRTPRRAIWHRLRPRLNWLESIVDSGVEPPTEPLPLTFGLS